MHASSHASVTHCAVAGWLALTSLMVGLLFGTQGAEPVVTTPKCEWRPLFNGRDLAGWDKHLSVPEGQIVPNHDPKGVFTVTNLNGQTVIHVSGEIYGAITSHDEFENFHARLEFKWGEKRWPPRATVGRDSGLLYCCIGKPNTGTGWMTSSVFLCGMGGCSFSPKPPSCFIARLRPVRSTNCPRNSSTKYLRRWERSKASFLC